MSAILSLCYILVTKVSRNRSTAKDSSILGNADRTFTPSPVH